MKNATKTPFESGYGFKSPGFSVDASGNIVATSFNIQEGSSGVVVDYTLYDNSNFFSTDNSTFNNPQITLQRGKTYTFALELTDFLFYIRQDDTDPDATEGSQILYSEGLTHSDGSTNATAQGKTTGNLSFTVPLTAPNTLYYASAQTGGTFGTFKIQDPAGLFSEVDITNTTQSTTSGTGALRVDGGIGVAKNATIGGQIIFDGVGIPDLISNTNINFGARNKVVIKMDGNTLGFIDTEALTVPIANSAITGGSINNTPIGATTPSTAAFTSASVTETPVNTNDVANKGYADNAAIAFSIAFGL